MSKLALSRTIISLNRSPINDLIGNPCPLSNLRPVYYSHLFPASHNSTTVASSSPYSLTEFPLNTSSSTSNSVAQIKLRQLKTTLIGQDLEYRLNCYRIDAFNQEFWSKTNTQFLLARDRYLMTIGGTKPLPGQAEGEIDLSPFYAQHLATTKSLYAEYNRQLWRLQLGLLWPALKAAARPWQWAWAVKRAGGEE